MSISIDVVIPILNQRPSSQTTLTSLKNNQQEVRRYIIVDNGSTPPVRTWLQGLSGDDLVIRNSENVGLPKALNQAKSVSKADYVFFTHSDIEMFEFGWDTKIVKVMEVANNTQMVGVAGFGALGISTNNIYRDAYEMNQLVRVHTISGNTCRLDPRIHGQMQFEQSFVKCAVLDGFSLIVKNVENLRFWDKSVHHMYDSDLCLESINQNYQNIVINIDINHYGGRTDVGENWAEVFGKTKQQIHIEAHPPFYDKWRPGKHFINLPYHV